MNQLPRIRAGLLRHPLDNQVLVYDTRDERVHLLDPTTACVLELLEEGGWTFEEISGQIVARLDVAPNDGFLPLALEELRKAGLLDETASLPEPMVDVNRRELVKKLAMTGAAALLVPTIATLTASRAYAQLSATLSLGATCTVSGQCFTNNCCAGICASSCPQANGEACYGDGGTQCASGNCEGGVCSPPRANGATCVADSQCASGDCGPAFTCI